MVNAFSNGLPQSSELLEKCGVVGLSHPDAPRLAYAALMALQHRGQDGAGIGVKAVEGFTTSKHLGLLSSGDWNNRLHELEGCQAIGHTRYATTGSSGNISYVQPVENSELLLAHNGNIPDVRRMKALLDQAPGKQNDSQLMAQVLSQMMAKKMSFEEALRSCWSSFSGSFSCVALTEGKVFAFRDSYGMRPLIYGSVGDGFIVASESVAIDAVGGECLADVKPGELLTIDANGCEKTSIADGRLCIDSLEFVYLARPDSVIEGVIVSNARRRAGELLALQDQELEADIVIGAPDSAVPAALGYHHISNILYYDQALVKNRYAGRTFITSGDTRKQAIQAKYNLVPGLLEGKSVVLVEDSIVRGSTLSHVVALLKERGGAKEVHLRIASPPVRHPDYYGIATPRIGELFANEKTVTDMEFALKVDSLKFLTVDELVSSIGLPKENLNLSHFTGEYPLAPKIQHPVSEEKVNRTMKC